MADNSLSSAASVLYEMRGPMQANYPKDNVLLAQWSGVGQDGAPGRITPLEDREAFSGSQVRVPIDVAMMQGGGWHSETGTVNAPIAAEITETHITLKRITQPASITLDLEEDSMDNSAIQGVAMLVKKAREALADRVNVAMNGDGTGLLATVASNTGSGTLVVPVASTTDWDLFPYGTVCDILTRSNGANPGNGKRRKVLSFDTSANTITFSTSQVASDGDSGNITFSSSEGIYVAGSYGQVLAGGLEAAGRGTSFQSVTLATYPTFKATDGRGGVATTVPFSENMADLGVEYGLRSGANGRYDFGIGDPSAIRVYRNGHLAQVHFQAPTGQLVSGFSGTKINTVGQELLLVPERKHKSGSIKFLRQDAASLYGRKKGPDFEDSTGAIWQRFARSWPKEMWLIDRLEWGWHDPSKILYFDGLSTS
jgi:hypothetical protein